MQFIFVFCMTLLKANDLFYIRLSFFLSMLICAVKFVAWVMTGSLVILSDALESIINVAAAAFAWYSIYLSNKPRDTEHPYGHGKIEFFSIGFEGAMILIAGIGILVQAVNSFIHPPGLNGGYLVNSCRWSKQFCAGVFSGANRKEKKQSYINR